MAKQRQVDVSVDNDLDMELETDFESALDVEDSHELTIEPSAETPPRTPALTPEAALEYLLNLGRTQGYVSYDDVLQVMPEAESNMDQLEDTFASLFEQGIEVGQNKEDDHAEPTDSEIAEEDSFDLSQIELDDSISL